MCVPLNYNLYYYIYPFRYDAHDIKRFQRILKDPKSCLRDDSYIQSYLDDLVRNIRAQVRGPLVALKPF